MASDERLAPGRRYPADSGPRVQRAAPARAHLQAGSAAARPRRCPECLWSCSLTAHQDTDTYDEELRTACVQRASGPGSHRESRLSTEGTMTTTQQESVELLGSADSGAADAEAIRTTEFVRV